jgi:hypothetical protein
LEELSASFIRVIRIDELAVTSNRRTLRGISSQPASDASYS